MIWGGGEITMTITELRKELQLWEEGGYGDKEILIFVDYADIFPIDEVMVDVGDSFFISCKSTESYKNWVKCIHNPLTETIYTKVK